MSIYTNWFDISHFYLSSCTIYSQINKIMCWRFGKPVQVLAPFYFFTSSSKMSLVLNHDWIPVYNYIIHLWNIQTSVCKHQDLHMLFLLFAKRYASYLYRAFNINSHTSFDPNCSSKMENWGKKKKRKRRRLNNSLRVICHEM